MSGNLSLEHWASLRRDAVEGFVLSQVLGEEVVAQPSEEVAAINAEQDAAAVRIAQMLAPQLAPDKRALPILSDAVKFCMIIADVLAERHIPLDIERIAEKYAGWTPVHPDEDIQEAYAYLEERAYLDDLINDYRKMIDPEERFPKEVEVVCGLVCKWIDEELALQSRQ